MHTHVGALGLASDNEDITYSQNNINLCNTEQITNTLDGAERGSVYSLNGQCAPLFLSSDIADVLRGRGE